MQSTRRANEKSSTRLRLTIQLATRSSSVPKPAKIRRWIVAALQQDADITIRFVGMQEGKQINQQFRGKAYATNVLSFCYQLQPLYGDIVICAPVVIKEAKQQKKQLEAHYAHLIVHGVLHLQGYDHVKNHEAVMMESLESEILLKLGYDDPY